MKRETTMLTAFAVVAAFALPSWAQVKQFPTETITIAGTIESIDYNRRAMNVKTADGKMVAVNVPESVQRFSEFKVGNHLQATYNNNVLVRLKPPGEPPVDNMAGSTSMGQEVQSGGTAAMLRTMTVTVTDVDKNGQSISVAGPNNWRYSRRVADPATLDKIKVGDKLDITWDTNVTLAPQ